MRHSSQCISIPIIQPIIVLDSNISKQRRRNMNIFHKDNDFFQSALPASNKLLTN